MKRIKRFHLLSLFGDMQSKLYDHAVALLTLHFANPTNRSEIWGNEKLPRNSYFSTEIEKLLNQVLEDGLIKRIETEKIKQLRLQETYQISPRDYELQITNKGRECLGMEQVARQGDYSWYGANYGFDGTLDKAAKINPNLFK